MSRARPLIALGAGLLLAVVVAACSGDSNSSSGAISGSSRTLNLSESAARISTLKSFRFNASASIDLGGQTPANAENALGNALMMMLFGNLKDIKLEGAVVAPDQMELKLSLGGQDFGFVQIGDKAWAKYGGAWTPIDPGDLGLPAGGLDFGDFTAGALPAEVVEAAKVSSEKVNGMNTTRYSFDKAALQSLANDVGSGQDLETANLDVWITEDGVPVKLTMKLKGKDDSGQESTVQLELVLKDLNSDIKIKAPM